MSGILRLHPPRLAAPLKPSYEVSLDGRHAGEFKSLVNVKNGGSVTWVFIGSLSGENSGTLVQGGKTKEWHDRPDGTVMADLILDLFFFCHLHQGKETNTDH